MKVPVSMIPSGGAGGFIAAIVVVALVAYAFKQVIPPQSQQNPLQR